MQLSDFHYELPEELIARYPLAERSASRLLYVPVKGGPQDRQVRDLPTLLTSGDVLVVNDTRVLKARLHGVKTTGGAIELLIERLISTTEAWVQLRASKPCRAGTVLLFGDRQVSATVNEKNDSLYRVVFEQEILPILEQYGELPIPPYFGRAADRSDEERYQTVFHDPAKAASVAAPTAGLHLDAPLLAALAARGVTIARVTLHVGAGTFQPVRVSDITQHTMHSEWAEVTPATIEAIATAKAHGGKVVAVGTTACRALESAARAHGGTLQAWAGETDIFMYPGFQFQVVDRLMTNFHLPESTLLMLVSAFAGMQPIRQAYQHAIAQKYRFFSYGDAMLLDRHPLAGH